MKLAKACVRAWVWFYTTGLTADERATRRHEIESDLWEFEADMGGASRFSPALHLILRVLLGIPDDLGWRIEHVTVGPTLTQSSVALSGRVGGAVLFVCALWVIDADSSRTRDPLRRVNIPSQEIEGDMTMRAAGKTLPVLMAGIAATIAPSVQLRLTAQSPSSSLAFEVASLRPNSSGYMGMTLDPQPAGRLTGTNVAPADLIRFAYDLPDFLLFGGPNWLRSDRFDVAAKAENDAPLDHMRLMVRRLLAERFKLTAHTEVRQLPIYALVTVTRDRRLGPQLRRTKPDCASTGTPFLSGIGPTPTAGPPACGYFGFSPETKFSEGRGGLAFRGLTMSGLAKVFVPILRRSIRDSTGLNGYFDGDFDFIAEIPLPPPPPGMPNPFEAPFASIFTVFPQQLGLKLESTRAPVDVLVIDRIERPAPE
jgi:uncharacterized protein (TIGR03435 family)